MFCFEALSVWRDRRHAGRDSRDSASRPIARSKCIADPDGDAVVVVRRQAANRRQRRRSQPSRPRRRSVPLRDRRRNEHCRSITQASAIPRRSGACFATGLDAHDPRVPRRRIRFAAGSARARCERLPPHAKMSAPGRCWSATSRSASFMLASPIILYDYPQIAPESAGDLFDGTEIDEILTLRIMSLTDEEKQEMRALDDRTRAILERTENRCRPSNWQNARRRPRRCGSCKEQESMTPQHLGNSPIRTAAASNRSRSTASK